MGYILALFFFFASTNTLTNKIGKRCLWELSVKVDYDEETTR
jgi:hypothetical protein